MHIIFLPIMLALYPMLFCTYYAQNYAGIIGAGLQWMMCQALLFEQEEGGERKPAN